MGRLIVIEGLDGSGKRTLTEALSARWRSEGRSVATMAFPRYGVDVHADLVRDALYGRLGDLSDSVYGPAVLFALDRRAAADEIRDQVAAHDEAAVRRDRIGRGTDPAQGPAVRARAVSDLEADAGQTEWKRRRVVDLDELAPRVVTDGVVEDLGDDRPRGGRTEGEAQRWQGQRGDEHAALPRGRSGEGG